MRRQFVAQVALHGLAVFGLLPAKLGQLAQQGVNLLLLAKDGLVQLVQQVFGVAGLDFQLGQAGVGVVRMFHGAIGPENQQAVARPPQARSTLAPGLDWPPRGAVETTHEAHLRELRQALAVASRQHGRFEVWVTHMFVLSALVGTRRHSSAAAPTLAACRVCWRGCPARPELF